MKITKKHKLYFRDKNLTIRRLDRVVPLIYIHILKEFLEKNANDLYLELNKDVKHWSSYKAIPMVLPEALEKSFNVLKKEVGDPYISSIIISYNGTWQPLVSISINEKENE